jgi:hypothetical protein
VRRVACGERERVRVRGIWPAMASASEKPEEQDLSLGLGRAVKQCVYAVAGMRMNEKKNLE